ncbi:MAG: TraK domain-containing protein [Thermodesulfobacteriota bacterium]
MWTELKRSKNNKQGMLCLLLLLVPFSAAGDGPAGDSHYWVLLGETKADLGSIQESMDKLPDEIDRQELRICLDENAYALVHTGATDPDAAFLIREKLSRLLDERTRAELVEYDPARCFATGHYLKKPSKETAKNPESAPRKTNEAPEAVHLRPAPAAYDSNDQTGKSTDRATVLSNSSVKILPGISTQVYLSNLDINRITCMGDRPVKDVIFSTEKGVTVKINGANAFVKLQLRPDDLASKPEVIREPVELYVVCGNGKDVYTLIGIPRKIPAQWVQLTSKDGDIQKNLSLFAGRDFEKKILTLVKQAVTEDFPDSYTMRTMARPIQIKGLEWLDITYRRLVRVDGEGFQLKEYGLTLSKNQETTQRRVLEKQFLVPQLAENPLAVTLDSLILTKDRPTRLFIIERADQATRLGVNHADSKGEMP